MPRRERPDAESGSVVQALDAPDDAGEKPPDVLFAVPKLPLKERPDGARLAPRAGDHEKQGGHVRGAMEPVAEPGEALANEGGEIIHGIESRRGARSEGVEDLPDVRLDRRHAPVREGGRDPAHDFSIRRRFVAPHEDDWIGVARLGSVGPVELLEPLAQNEITIGKGHAEILSRRRRSLSGLERLTPNARRSTSLF